MQKSRDFVLPKTNDQIFPFHIFFHICAKILTQKKEKETGYDMCIWMFSITSSHFERITWIFLCMMGAITIFRKNSFRFSFVDYGLVEKSLGARENKMSKDECEYFTTKLGQIMSPSL